MTKKNQLKIINYISDISSLMAKHKMTDYYSKQYEAFVNYPRNLEEIGLNEFHVIYGYVFAWIPRQQSFMEQIEEKDIKFLSNFLEKKNNNNVDEKIKNNKSNIEELNKKLYKGPDKIVAMTKLLHFINPNQFPILDSRVADECNIVINWDNYWKLREKISEIKEKKEIVRNVSIFTRREKNQNELSIFRCVDIVLFYWSKNSLNLSYYGKEKIPSKVNNDHIKFEKIELYSTKEKHILLFNSNNNDKYDDWVRNLKITKHENKYKPREKRKKSKHGDNMKKKKKLFHETFENE